MANGDDKVRAAYSSLPREEPPASIDAAILAASRRALARPSASRRWAGPVSIAAVLVLAFGVTLHMQREAPGIESPDRLAEKPSAPPPQAAAPVPSIAPPAAVERDKDLAKNEVFRQQAQKKMKAAPAAKPDAESERGLRDEARADSSDRKEPKLAAAGEAPLAKEAHVEQAPPAVAAAPAVPPAASAVTLNAPASSAVPPAAARAAPAEEMRLKREAAVAQAPRAFADQAAPQGKIAAAADAQARIDERTRDLEAIAKLRAEGRHEEADKALAEFRRRHPDYRIPDAMWERVKPR